MEMNQKDIAKIRQSRYLAQALTRHEFKIYSRKPCNYVFACMYACVPQIII